MVVNQGKTITVNLYEICLGPVPEKNLKLTSHLKPTSHLKQGKDNGSQGD